MTKQMIKHKRQLVKVGFKMKNIKMEEKEINEI